MLRRERQLPKASTPSLDSSIPPVEKKQTVFAVYNCNTISFLQSFFNSSIFCFISDFIYYLSLCCASHHYIQESVSRVDVSQILTLTPLICLPPPSPCLCSSRASTWCATAGRTLFTSLICCAHRAWCQPCPLCLLFLSFLWLFSAMWIKSIGFSNKVSEESETFLSSFSKSFCTVKAKRPLYELCYICTQSDKNSLIWMWRMDRNVSGYVLPAQRGKAETARADSPTSLLLTRDNLFALRAEFPCREVGQGCRDSHGCTVLISLGFCRGKPEKALGLSITMLH